MSIDSFSAKSLSVFNACIVLPTRCHHWCIQFMELDENEEIEQKESYAFWRQGIVCKIINYIKLFETNL